MSGRGWDQWQGGAHLLVPKDLSHWGDGVQNQRVDRALGGQRPEATVPWTNHSLFLGLSFLFWKTVENQQDDPKSLILCGRGEGGEEFLLVLQEWSMLETLPPDLQVLARTCLGLGEGRGAGEMGQRW